MERHKTMSDEAEPELRRIVRELKAQVDGLEAELRAYKLAEWERRNPFTDRPPATTIPFRSGGR